MFTIQLFDSKTGHLKAETSLTSNCIGVLKCVGSGVRMWDGHSSDTLATHFKQILKKIQNLLKNLPNNDKKSVPVYYSPTERYVTIYRVHVQMMYKALRDNLTEFTSKYPDALWYINVSHGPQKQTVLCGKTPIPFRELYNEVKQELDEDINNFMNEKYQEGTWSFFEQAELSENAFHMVGHQNKIFDMGIYCGFRMIQKLYEKSKGMPGFQSNLAELEAQSFHILPRSFDISRR